MKKLTSKMSKSFLLFQRALVLFGFAMCSLLVNAGGSYYYGDLTIQKYVPSPSINPLGKGKVYMKYYESAWGQTQQGDASVEFDCTNTQQSEVLNAGDHSYASGSDIYVGIAVHPKGTNSFFAGWYDTNGNSTSVDTDNNLKNRKPTVDANATNVEYYLYSFAGKKNDKNNPTTATLQAHLGRKVHIMSYDGVEDKWVDNISTSDPDRYAYSANINSPQFSLLYNLVLHSKLGDKTVTLKANDNSPFNLSLEAGPNDAEGRKTWRLTVTPKGVAESYVDNVVFQIDGADVVTLALNLSRKPITVTLNPAEDLTGRYTYTQNTAPTDEFVVTTSAVVKQMITATDYSFTFYPTPEDPSKYQFEKWVIKNAEGEIIEESITPDLSYRFSGGESITPVFTTFDRAVFIVKSEPAIQYTDLQQALDRAAALTTTTGKNQTVVVTVDAEGKRKGGRLVQGTYTITNGVTFLIPGEKSYEEMKGDLKDSHFQEEGSDHNAFCTLSVDDDTKIIVKNGGSISLYAKLVRTTTYTNGYITFNYGHMILGRNCQINVENGGQLHAFGFITGDPSSHVTMESGSLIYEPFTMTDWRGGSETSSKWVLGSDGKNARVFPIGQYYVQSVEVPLTFKAGARERLSCSVDAGVTATVNMDYISNYSDAEGLFGLGEGTSLTRTYNPATDRVKYAFNGTGTSSKVKLGCMNLKLRVAIFNIDINSKDFVMPIQNNIDIDVKNTTIDVKYDLACLPASTMRVHDDAIINVESNANVYIYDRGARRFATDASDAKGFGGYWMSQNKVIVPLSTKARPGGIQYGHTNAAGKFTAGRTEEDLVDASWIINGDMNIHGALYTVCGNFAETDDKDPNAQGGADISSEGSGKINVYNIGTKTTINQWDQANAVGAVTIPITQYLLLHNDLLHNDLSKGATAAYTPVKNESNQNLSSNPLSYTYYQHDGTWRLPIAGITGIKLYDAEDHEITNFYVTLPNDNVTGYLLATLEPMPNIEYDVNDFDIRLSEDGNIAIVNDDDNKPAIVNDGKQLKIPVVYTPKNIHGEHPQTLTITSLDAGFDCDFKETLLAIEDYNPIFEAPTTMNIYGRVSEDNHAALLIKPADKNITTLSEVNPNMVWTYEITSTNDDKEQFDFKFGEGDGNKLAGAQVIFTPNSVGEKKAKLILTATYKDAGNPQNVLTKVHNVELVGNGLIIDNTMEFNNVGTITTSTTNAFNLLCNVNSTGTLHFYIVDGATETEVPFDATYTTHTSNDIIDIQYITIGDKGNYLITPKRKIGQVTVKVSQEGTTSHSSKEITTTIIVVGDPKPLEGQGCLDENTFPTLTEDLDFVEYDATLDRLNFVGDGSSSTWTAQFASAPGVLTFTPHGDGYWAVQESMDGVNWSELIWWTQLPADKEVYVILSPRTRRLKISYRKINEIGSITNLCISPFSIYAETTKSYVPVKDGSILPTSIVFTHATPDVVVSIKPKNAAQLDLTNLSEPTLSTSISDNLGGVLNTFYQTTVTLSGGANIPELNDAFTLIAKHGTEEAEVTLATYAFPKPLPMESNTWVSDDAKNNINGYDEAEYYNHYMVSSKNVKWDADPERRNLVFLNPGSKSGDQALRQVVFGYMGLPDELRFQSAATGWKIEQSIDGTSTSWVDLNAQSITPTDGKYTIPLTNDPQYVRITYEGTEQNEVLISNLIIEGFPSAVPTSTEVVITKTDDQEPSETFAIHVRNLPSMQLQLDRTDVFELYDQNGTKINYDTPLTSDSLALNKKGDITITAKWTGTTSMLDEGFVKILNPSQDNAEMATIRLVGKMSGITASVTNTGIWTGVPDGSTNTEKHTLKDSKNIFEPYTYHEVNLANTFDENQNPLFDYLIIFGETTTTDNNTDILQPTNEIGSNAKTPYYIYKRDVDKKSYEFVNAIANANSAEKGVDGTVIVQHIIGDNKTSYIDVQDKEISVYITGFCPYATTGYTKNEEGVFLFRGKHGDKLDVYLDNCHIYSRNKSLKGTSFYGEKEGGETYSEGYARGSGGVLVFENMDAQEQLDLVDPFEVNIHTRGDNLLNSNYGCFFGLQIGNSNSIAMKAYQVSSPIQVHMFSDNHVNKTETTLNFDDIWPTGEQTNGYLALKKQANNAPSIDMGNKYTEVNFNGGRIKLQNSQIVSGTYKTTLAISYRAGFFGAEEAGIKLCHGIGTDAVDGVVNFNDGTVTVERMKVAEEHRQYYLMDLNDDGTESEYTTCLRTPKNTFIKGGSICRVRACQSVTSKGGGPKEDVDKRLLGQYVYNVIEKGETPKENGNGTYTITIFPSNITDLGSYTYGLNSITPDENGNCYFWIPDGYGGVTAEKDVYMATWKACMTKIGAGIPDVAEGEVGGDIRINEDEEVQNFLYCQLDKNIHDVISAVDDKGAYTYQAPLEVPSVAQSYFKGKYTKWAPNKVGEHLQHQVLSEKSYTITNRVYYITTATADIWKTFTAPFDVANIYVVETFKEDMLEKMNSRSEILKVQAQHNADFAAFFGVAMAMGTTANFEGIYNSYIEWAKIQDKEMNLWNGRDKYTIRGMQKLTPYFGNNWRDANFYLNVNNGDWKLIGGEKFEVNWEMLPDTAMADGILLHKGKTYSLMFPYCPGCEFGFSERDYWDYWSGKFLIFEGVDKPQTINGSDFLDESAENTVFVSPENENEVVVTGNSTFAYLTTSNSNVYRYVDNYPSMLEEQFKPVTTETTIYPSTAFLYGYVPTNAQGMPAKAISRTGQIIYDNSNDNGDGTTTGGNIPTVGGGNDLFITSTATGINIAVAEPQQVRVMSATGATLFSGMVQTAVDVFLPTAGVYVVAGENEVHKILH